MKNSTIKKIPHMSYVRDLGGLTTLNGEVIDNNILFRTSRLSKIKKKQVNTIKNEYHISKVIDLRTKEEQDAFPDVVIDSVKYNNYPVLSNFDNPVVKHGNLRKSLYDIINLKGGSINYLKSCYEKLVTSDLAITNYHNTIIDIANSTDPIFYHCTQGKDRTGVLSALILLSLGVSEEDVINDYLKYNNVGKLKRGLIYIGVFILTFSIKAVRETRNLLIARKEYIIHVINTIKEKFNSIDNYIKNILKLDEEVINKLKRKLFKK